MARVTLLPGMLMMVFGMPWARYAAHLCSGEDAVVSKVPGTLCNSCAEPGRTGSLLHLLQKQGDVTGADCQA